MTSRLFLRPTTSATSLILSASTSPRRHLRTALPLVSAGRTRPGRQSHVVRTKRKHPIHAEGGSGASPSLPIGNFFSVSGNPLAPPQHSALATVPPPPFGGESGEPKGGTLPHELPRPSYRQPSMGLKQYMMKHPSPPFLGENAVETIRQCTIRASDNPFPGGFKDKQLGYYVNDALKQELLALTRPMMVPPTKTWDRGHPSEPKVKKTLAEVCRDIVEPPLLEPPASTPNPKAEDNDGAKQLVSEETVACELEPAPQRSTLGDVIDAIPSSSGRIIVLSSPYKGGEIQAETVATALASELGASFISVGTEDIIQRFSPNLVHTTKLAVLSPSAGHSMVDSPMSRINTARMGLGGIKIGHIIAGPQDEHDDETPGLLDTEGGKIPSPWYRPYATGRSQSTQTIACTDYPDVPEPSKLIGGALDQFVKNLDLSAPHVPKIVFLRDFLPIIDKSGINGITSAMLAAICRNKPESGSPLLFVIPASKTFAKKVKPQGGLPMMLKMMGGNQGGEEEEEESEDGSGDEYDFSDDDYPGNGFSAGGEGDGRGGPSGGEVSEMKKSAKSIPATEFSSKPLSFAHSLENIAGIQTVPLIPPPPTDRTAFSDFRRTLEGRDLARINALANLREIELASSFAGVPLSFEIPSAKLGRFPLAESIAKRCSSQLLKRRLSQIEVERILTLSVGLADPLETPPVSVSPVSLTLDHLMRASAMWERSSNALNDVVAGSGELYHGLRGMKGEPLRPKLSEREKTLLKQCLVVARNDGSNTVGFGDIGGLDETKRAVREVIELPLKRPELFSFGVLRKSTTGILLFGPPGTGKTMLAKAVAAEAGANFLSIEMNQVQSMWVGEAEKNIKAIFTVARKISPCVLFVDEVDALLGARGAHTPRWASSAVNDFMQQWDGISKNNEGVIVVGATNRPFALDDAVLRRLPRRILVNLPDESEREKILRLQLDGELIGDDVDVRELAKKTKGYSGSDLKNVAISTALSAIREQNAKPDSSPSRTLHIRHFETALKTVLPSIKADSSDLMKQLLEWNSIYGTGSKSGGLGFV